MLQHKGCTCAIHTILSNKTVNAVIIKALAVLLECSVYSTWTQCHNKNSHYEYLYDQPNILTVVK